MALPGFSQHDGIADRHLPSPRTRPQIKMLGLIPRLSTRNLTSYFDTAAPFPSFFSFCAASSQTSRPVYDCISPLIFVLAYFFWEPPLASCGGFRRSPSGLAWFVTPGFDRPRKVDHAQSTITIPIPLYPILEPPNVGYGLRHGMGIQSIV